jgi:hypothetical protein
MARTKPSQQKPISFSSTPLRKALEHRNGQGQFVRAFTALDEIGKLYDSIDTLHKTPDPSLTKEGRAIRYKTHTEKAREKASRLANSTIEDLIELESSAIREAEEKAGLHRTLSDSEAREIREAIRALPPAERDTAIRDAAMNGDSAIIQAVRLSPTPLLVGGAAVPETLITAMIENANPELAQLREEIVTALDAVGYACQVLAEEINVRRDPILEERAEQQAQATKKAEDSLLGVGNEAAV